jgi:hypothetical protein
MQWAVEKVRRARKAARSGRFNTRDQHEWGDRASVAVDLCIEHVGGEHIRVADLGAGNERIRDLLDDRGASFDYEAYDLIPQLPTTTRLDLSRDMPSGPFDVAFVLGVLEYMADPHDVIDRLCGVTEHVVISYLPVDGRLSDSQVERARLGWRNHLTVMQFETAFVVSGMELVARETQDATDLWVWRSNHSA